MPDLYDGFSPEQAAEHMEDLWPMPTSGCVQVSAVLVRRLLTGVLRAALCDANAGLNDADKTLATLQFGVAKALLVLQEKFPSLGELVALEICDNWNDLQGLEMAVCLLLPDVGVDPSLVTRLQEIMQGTRR